MAINLSNDDLDTGELQLGKRHAVIAVDLSNGFALPSSPLGGDFTEVLAANKRLMLFAKQHNIPIFFTTVVYDTPEQASVFRQRLPDLNILQRDSHWVNIHDELKGFVEANNLLEKNHPSAFFNTDLHEKLKKYDIDSLIITGLTSSGCVRASCVDGLQYNYSCIVISDACGDRNPQAHDMSLHDMHAKYAQVMTVDEMINRLQ